MRHPGDNGQEHDLVLRRSEDEGATWGDMIVVQEGQVPCPGCPAAISNPNPVEVVFPDNTSKILLHYDTMNNPSPTTEHHGLDMQKWSTDDGLTWSNGTVLEFPPNDNKGDLIGPSVGIQNANGTLFFSNFIGHQHWLYWSTDYGVSWRAADPVSDVNECSIALVDPSLPETQVIGDCRTSENKRGIVYWSLNEDSSTYVPSNVSFPDGLVGTLLPAALQHRCCVMGSIQIAIITINCTHVPQTRTAKDR